jgi:hypothetical protein
MTWSSFPRAKKSHLLSSMSSLDDSGYMSVTRKALPSLLHEAGRLREIRNRLAKKVAEPRAGPGREEPAEPGGSPDPSPESIKSIRIHHNPSTESIKSIKSINTHHNPSPESIKIHQNPSTESIRIHQHNQSIHHKNQPHNQPNQSIINHAINQLLRRILGS